MLSYISGTKFRMKTQTLLLVLAAVLELPTGYIGGSLRTKLSPFAISFSAVSSISSLSVMLPNKPGPDGLGHAF